MEEFATKFADRLDEIAGKIRSQTVDRANRFTRLAAAGLVVVVLTPVVTVFLSIAVFRVVAAVSTVEVAYAIFGGLFIALGALLWRKKDHPPAPPA